MDTLQVDKFKALSRELRVEILRMLHEAGSGHPGGSLSVIDLLVVLWNHFIKYDPKNPKWNDRDRFILSKGHCIPALYAVWADLGFMDKSELKTLRKMGSRLQGHPDRKKCEFVEANTGSLGQGLSMGLGMALAAKLDKRANNVYVVTGDGEIEQGQVWEAALMAPKYKLDNLVWIIDANQVQQENKTEVQSTLEPLKPKLEAFNWHVQEIDGHDHGQILTAVQAALDEKGKPSVIVARTVKGKGVSFMELQPGWHGVAPDAAKLEEALKELKWK